MAGVVSVSPDEIVKAVTEVLKILAWPAVVGVIFLYLRKEIKSLAPRITEAGWQGIKAAPPNQNPSPPPSGGISTVSGGSITVGISGISSTAMTADTDHYSKTGSETEAQTSPSRDAAPFIAKLKANISEDQLDGPVKAIRDDLPKNVGPDLKNQVEALIYFCAALNVALTHERNYNAIFGSQLRLLEQMNPATGVPPSVARQIYDEAKAAFPDVYRDYTFDQWIGFLQNGGLIDARGGLGTGGNYVLTPYGRGFLKYLIDRRLAVNRPF
jgi:hypothetical protein